MQPDQRYITIDNNLPRIEQLLQDLVFQPRIKALAWSGITRQTPNLKIGYPGQHLSSLITGIEGLRTGARGDDLLDGTEVKSCSRVDQLDTCQVCKNKVLRIENACSNCGSDRIKRMDDSKWLFSIKSQAELELLTERINRIFLTIADYPQFDNGQFDTIRIQAFEIWNNTHRCRHFKTLMTNYYNKIFLEHIGRNASKTPAPKNFWPFSYQFHLCNPVKVFQCTVTDANTNPTIGIDYYVQPHEDRSQLPSVLMPTTLLSPGELQKIFVEAPREIIMPQIINSDYDSMQRVVLGGGLNKRILERNFPFIDEQLREYTTLRDTDIIAVAKKVYTRR